MKILITGISGQDGSYLAEYLLSLGHEVHGVVRRNSNYEYPRLKHLHNIHLHFGDVLDYPSLHNIFTSVKPDQIYNLAGQSDVRISFDLPQMTAQVNGVGALNVLECFRTNCSGARLFQAFIIRNVWK